MDGWEGNGPQAIAVELMFDLEGADPPLRSLVVDALTAMGLDINGTADATITLDLTGTAKGGSYGSAGYGHTGGRVRGDIILSASDRPDLHFEVDGDYPAPFGVSTASCNQRREPEDAPFTYAFEPEFKDAMVEWWGPTSIPYLADILNDGLSLDRIRIETIQAVRLMTCDEVSPEYQYLILDAELWFCGRTTYQTREGEIVRYREAVTRLFAEALDLDVEVLDDDGGRAAQRSLDRAYGK